MKTLKKFLQSFADSMKVDLAKQQTADRSIVCWKCSIRGIQELHAFEWKDGHRDKYRRSP